ncbi:MAG: hypothetical protein ACLPH3_22385 [Terracidiphilus sp.]
MTERYSDEWVETQVTRCAEQWNSCAADWELPEPRYSRRDHEAREIAYDAEMHAVEWEARHAPHTVAARAETQNRLIASFAQFAANALDLEPESTALLTRDFLPAGIEFARRAREFDANLSQADTIQACRNAWTACGLQPLLGVPSGISPSILGYSLLYPYTDNYLDSEAVPFSAKVTFSERFRERLRGLIPVPRNRHEEAVWALVGLIEGEYPRDKFPEVFACLLAIHQAQEDSIAQQRNGGLGDAELLRLSFAKGGTSVLTDAALARGWTTEEESQVAFEWGALLQLGDDLQDVRDDLRSGSITLFTRAVMRGVPLDHVVLQLLHFCERIAARMRRLPNGALRLKELLQMSWRSLIIAAVADAHQFFSPRFLIHAEGCSPFRFEFLRAGRKRLASRQGLYSVLFDLFVETPSPEVPDSPKRHNRTESCVEAVV